MPVTLAALLGAALAGAAPRAAWVQQPDSAVPAACGCPMMQGATRQRMMMPDTARAAMRAQHGAAMQGNPQCMAMMREHMAAMRDSVHGGMSGGMAHRMITGADSAGGGMGLMPRAMRDSAGPGAAMRGHGGMRHAMPGAPRGGMSCPGDSTRPRGSGPPAP
jgi:hypothetical protein